MAVRKKWQINKAKYDELEERITRLEKIVEEFREYKKRVTGDTRFG